MIEEKGDQFNKTFLFICFTLENRRLAWFNVSSVFGGLNIWLIAVFMSVLVNNNHGIFC